MGENKQQSPEPPATTLAGLVSVTGPPSKPHFPHRFMEQDLQLAVGVEDCPFTRLEGIHKSPLTNPRCLRH